MHKIWWNSFQFSEFAQYIPIIVHPFIEDVVDVKADYNYGFRVVASYIYNNEGSYQYVRDSLSNEG